MAGLLANACSEEPDALIALVRVCGGAPRVTGGSPRKTRERAGAVAEVFLQAQNRRTQTLARLPSGIRLPGERRRSPLCKRACSTEPCLLTGVRLTLHGEVP